MNNFKPISKTNRAWFGLYQI